MDRLTREIYEHDNVLEELFLFENYLKVFSLTSSENYIKRIHFFLDEFIVNHFEFEEEEIFPFILKECNSDEKQFIQQLCDEHAVVLKHVAEFKDKILSYGTPLDTDKICDILISIQPVMSMIRDHARKEDERLLPAIKKYLATLNGSGSA